MNQWRCMTDRTYAIFVNAMKSRNLFTQVQNAYNWFASQSAETIREAGKTGIVKFILEHMNEWNK